jgi:hypothetical protein
MSRNWPRATWSFPTRTNPRPRLADLLLPARPRLADHYLLARPTLASLQVLARPRLAGLGPGCVRPSGQAGCQAAHPP